MTHRELFKTLLALDDAGAIHEAIRTALSYRPVLTHKQCRNDRWVLVNGLGESFFMTYATEQEAQAKCDEFNARWMSRCTSRVTE